MTLGTGVDVCITQLLLPLLLVSFAHAAPRIEVASGQSWRFREAVIRAQCEATCLSKYGEEPAVDPLWLDTYEVYVPLTCPPDGPCSQCLNPCRYIFGSVEQCYTTCAAQPCRQSCDNVYSLWAQEQRTHAVAQSADRVQVTAPEVTCQTLRHFAENGAGSYAYVKWDVTEGQQPAKPLPLSFVTEIRTQVNGSATSWVPYSGNHAWVPIGVNWSTPYHLRVTPVRRDGVAGSPRTSKWITTLSERAELMPPGKLYVSHQRVVDNQVYVTFNWEQEQDLMPCHYELNLLADSHNINSVSTSIALVPQSHYQYGPLPYGQSYTAKLASCTSDGRCSERTVSTDFTTLGCLEVNGYNYLLCEPEKPNKVHLGNIVEYFNHGNNSEDDCLAEVEIDWSEPEHAAPTNQIIAYKLTWNKVPDFWRSHMTKPHDMDIQISGNLTSYKIRGLHLASRYLIRLRAVSVGGQSGPVSIYVNTTGNDTLCTGNSGIVLEATAAGQQQNKHYTLSLIIIPFLVVTVTMIFVIMFLRWKRRPKQREFSQTILPHDHMTGNPLYHSMKSMNPDAPSRSGSFSGEPYEIDPRDLILEEVIGQGAFGKVVKGHLKVIPRAIKGCKSAPLLVAVKLLKDYAGPSDVESLRQEIELMKGLGRHPNIVSMVACVTRGPHLCLVMDFCHHGDLRAYLRNLRQKFAPLMHCYRGMYTGSTRTSSSTAANSKETITTDITDVNLDEPVGEATRGKDLLDGAVSRGDYAYSCGLYIGERRVAPDSVSDCLRDEVDISLVRLLSFARQITVGMEYLAQKRFIHRDLAARNILVCEDGLLKISDFGLTRDIYESNCYRKKGEGKLPIKWMSVEAIFDQVYTIQSDVWSFGIVLWEIVTLGGSPYPGVVSSDLYKLLKEGYRMEKPDGCSDKLYELMISCWRTAPSERPTFTDLRRQLEKMLEETSAEDDDNSYLNLDLQETADPSEDKEQQQQPLLTPTSDSGTISHSLDRLVAEGSSSISSPEPERELPPPPADNTRPTQRTPHPLLRLISSRSDSEPLLAQLDRSLQHQHPRRQNLYSQLSSGRKPSRSLQHPLSGSLGNICQQTVHVPVRSDTWEACGSTGHARKAGSDSARPKLSSAARQPALQNSFQVRQDITVDENSLEEKPQKSLPKSRLADKTQEFLKCYLKAGPVGNYNCEPANENCLAVDHSDTLAVDGRM